MNPAINLTHLKFFCDAVQYNSISESAKMNYVTQSTVSQAIIKLEKIFLVQLIGHSKQRLIVTPEGRVLFDQARYIFQAVQEAHDKINKSQDLIRGDLKFVSTHSLGISFIPYLYKQMQELFPGINLSFNLGGLNVIRTALKLRKAEFAIVVNDHNFTQFDKYPLKKGRFHLYESSDNDHNSLEKGIFIDHAEGMYVAEMKNFLFHSKYNKVKFHAPLSAWEAVARFVEMDLGVGFLPDYITNYGRYLSLRKHPLELLPFEYEICAIYNKGEKPSSAAEAFFECFS